MKSLYYILAFVATALLSSTISFAAPTSDTLQVVNWNIEYFGDPGHHDPTMQATGLRTMMKAINADVYAMCEVVNVDSFASVIQSLPGNYGYSVSTFGSFAASPTSSGYSAAQKLAFVYRRSRVRNIQVRALLAGSSNAYYNFSSGRFPYEVVAEVMGKDSIWQPVTFIILHAKAYTDGQSCMRRTEACRELKDTLDAFYPTRSFLLLGDFNDDLDVSNCASASQSNYAAMVADSIHYKSLTLPISRSGAFSIDGYSSLIDHVIASDEMARYYVPGSASVLRSFVKSIDPAYSKHVSDHYPVRTSYVIETTATSVKESKQPALIIYPNPARHFIQIESGDSDWSDLAVYDLNGRVSLQQAFPQGGTLSLPELPDGLYILCAKSKKGNTARQLFRVGQ